MIYALKAVDSGRLCNRLNIWATEMGRYRRVWEMFKPHQSSEIQVKTTINCCFSSITTVKVKQEGKVDTDIQGSQTNTLPEQCKLMQYLWKAIWKYVMPFDTVNPLLVICPKKI